MVVKECKRCGVQIHAIGNKKFCSYECRVLKAKIRERVCKECGEKFETKIHNKKFCCRSCGNRFDARKRKKTILPHEKGYWNKGKKNVGDLIKECRLCGEEFKLNANSQQYCNPCRTGNPYYLRKGKIRDIEKKYNLTEIEYDDLRKTQNYCCCICKQHEKKLKRGLCVDHDHNTGKIRGLLCDVCNQGLGYFKDNATFLKTAIKYLGGEQK